MLVEAGAVPPLCPGGNCQPALYFSAEELWVSYTNGLVSPFTQCRHLNLGKWSFPGCISTSVERSSFCTSFSRLGGAVMAEQVQLWLSFCRSLLPFKK